MRVWAIAMLAGCSFRTGTFSAPDGAGSDVMLDAALDAPSGPIALLQEATAVNAGNNNIVTASFPSDQSAGSLDVVVVSWRDNEDAVLGIADTKLNLYFSATAQLSSEGLTQRIYYAPNIRAGENAVTVMLTGNVPDPRLRIFEYAGIAPSLPVDQVAAASDESGSAQAGPITTTHPHELLFAAVSAGSMASGPGADYIERQRDSAGIVQEHIVETPGSYSASVPLGSSSDWIMQLVSFKAL